jgi:hypothetical protein
VFSDSIHTGYEALPISFPTGFVQAVSPRSSDVDCGLKLTTHLCLIPRLKMSAVISSLLYAPYGMHWEHFSFTFPKLVTIFSCYPWQNVCAAYVMSSLYAQAIQLL